MVRESQNIDIRTDDGLPEFRSGSLAAPRLRDTNIRFANGGRHIRTAETVDQQRTSGNSRRSYNPKMDNDAPLYEDRVRDDGRSRTQRSDGSFGNEPNLFMDETGTARQDASSHQYTSSLFKDPSDRGVSDARRYDLSLKSENLFASEMNTKRVQAEYKVEKGLSEPYQNLSKNDSKLTNTDGEVTRKRKASDRKGRNKKENDDKAGAKGRTKNPLRQTTKIKKAVTNPIRSVAGSLKQSAEGIAGSGQSSGMNNYDFARDTFAEKRKATERLMELLRTAVKVVKAIVATALLPFAFVMAFIAVVIASIVTFISGADSDSGRKIPNPTSEMQVVYNGLIEEFAGNREATIGVMCALMAESGCRAKATEAKKTWDITEEDYTDQVNDYTVSKEDFINSIYDGVQGSRGYGIAQWSTVDRKKGLYEYASRWALDHKKSFDIGNIEMQVDHLRETIRNNYSSLKEELIAEKDIQTACYKWISTYERPSQKYSTWEQKAERDVKAFEDKIREECVAFESSVDQGIFLWPCPSSKHITSYFGNRTPPTAGATSNHKAIDIGAAKGASVIAAAAGKVTAVTYSSARGYYIIVDHGGGYETLYQHLSRQDVAVGDLVTAGQQIGAVGDTGISDGPHLHFEVHVNGTPVDPMNYFE